MVKIPDTTTFGPATTSTIWQSTNPWDRLAVIAKRVGVKPTDKTHVSVLIRSGGEDYDAFEVIEGVLDYIDRKTKDE